MSALTKLSLFIMPCVGLLSSLECPAQAINPEASSANVKPFAFAAPGPLPGAPAPTPAPTPPADAVMDCEAGVPVPLPSVLESVIPTCTGNSFSLMAQLKFDPSIAGQTGKKFVGARVPPYATAIGLTPASVQSVSALMKPSEASETWLVNNGATWTAYQGGEISSVYDGQLNQFTAWVKILDNADPSKLCGTEFYAGYGTSGDAMLVNNTLGKAYTVMCNFIFSGSASGSNSNLTLSAQVQVATVDSGKAGKFYVGRLSFGTFGTFGTQQWHLHDGVAWVPYSGGPIPAYATGTLTSRTIQIFNNEDVSAYSGSQVYVGYGLSDDDLLGRSKYKVIYTIQ